MESPFLSIWTFFSVCLPFRREHDHLTENFFHLQMFIWTPRTRFWQSCEKFSSQSLKIYRSRSMCEKINDYNFMCEIFPDDYRSWNSHFFHIPPHSKTPWQQWPFTTCIISRQLRSTKYHGTRETFWVYISIVDSKSGKIWVRLSNFSSKKIRKNLLHPKHTQSTQKNFKNGVAPMLRWNVLGLWTWKSWKMPRKEHKKDFKLNGR